jgi:lipopolysaccharide export system permease protein
VYVKEPGLFRAELHDRLMGPLYPLAFMFIVFAYLGAPRTTRQGRGMALAAVISVALGLRMVGFASTVFGMHRPGALLLQYVAMAAVFWTGSTAISRGTIIEPPAFVTHLISAVGERLSRRLATT